MCGSEQTALRFFARLDLHTQGSAMNVALSKKLHHHAESRPVTHGDRSMQMLVELMLGTLLIAVLIVVAILR